MLAKLPLVSAAAIVLVCLGLLLQMTGSAAPTPLAPQSCVCDLEITMVHTYPPPATCFNSATLYTEAQADGNCANMGCGEAADCEYVASISLSGNNCSAMGIFETCESFPAYLNDCYSCNFLAWSTPADPEVLECGQKRCFDAFACDNPCGFAGNLVARITVECHDCP